MYQVDEVPMESDKNIAIRISGEDLSFVATQYSVDVYINEKVADSIAFHIQSIIQDRSIRYSEKELRK